MTKRAERFPLDWDEVSVGELIEIYDGSEDPNDPDVEPLHGGLVRVRYVSDKLVNFEILNGFEPLHLYLKERSDGDKRINRIAARPKGAWNAKLGDLL